MIAGNGTLEAARSLGMERLDVVRTDLEGIDAVAFAIADNRTAELAGWDFDALRRIAEELPPDLLEDAGWSDLELAAVLTTDWAKPPDPEVVDVDDDEPLGTDHGGHPRFTPDEVRELTAIRDRHEPDARLEAFILGEVRKRDLQA